MAVDPYLRRPPSVVAVTMSWRGKGRTLTFGRTAALSVFVVLPLLAVWYLGATAYLVFHDQLLASLLAGETEAQYAYEDRIAGLRTQLDSQTSRSLVDRQTLATTLSDLAARSERLEARAAAIDALVGGIGSMAGSRPAKTNGSRNAAAPALSKAPDRTIDPEDHVELSPDSERDRLAAVLAGVESRQSAQVARIRDPMVRAVDRLRTALADTGLPLSRWHVADATHDDIGGPFVPLPRAAPDAGFGQDIAFLQDAAVQHARLSGIVDSVPIRRPVDGPIAVTSPFGERLDPFFGRPAMHTGLDLMDAYGGPVLATASGIVTIAGPEGGYGNLVEIDHGNGLVTRYGHLASIEVVAHQKVAAGTIVGRVGSTGRATGPHLHYETRINGEPVDPLRFLQAGASLFPG